ncbi:MAG: SUMF1/EgtB/PvdO family nonheme iron enzyme [Chloroflexi bacterium]|nr:SUMF1/EgtB/PvdO family nonheme iron enzyme [Chloroflexota bacterium]
MDALPQPDMVSLEGGVLLMGSARGRPDEQPVHRVEIAPFRAARSPVTNAQFAPFLETGHELPRFWDDNRFNAPDQPVVGVNWFDAVAYCEWLASETRVPYRLPSEAEREYASLGGLEAADWPWPGDRWQGHPVADRIAANDRPHPSPPECANGYGLRCMAENVHEWCLDWYHPRGYAEPGAGDREPAERARRVSRGGSWRHSVKFTRLTARASLAPERRYNDFGFRLYADA